jgi:hypothetical protein
MQHFLLLTLKVKRHVERHLLDRHEIYEIMSPIFSSSPNHLHTFIPRSCNFAAKDCVPFMNAFDTPYDRCFLWFHLFYAHCSVHEMRWTIYNKGPRWGEKRELRWPVLFLEWEVVVIGGEMAKWAKHLIKSYTTKSFKTKKHKIGLQVRKNQ